MSKFKDPKEIGNIYDIDESRFKGRVEISALDIDRVKLASKPFNDEAVAMFDDVPIFCSIVFEVTEKDELFYLEKESTIVLSSERRLAYRGKVEIIELAEKFVKEWLINNRTKLVIAADRLQYERLVGIRSNINDAKIRLDYLIKKEHEIMKTIDIYDQLYVEYIKGQNKQKETIP